MSLHSRVSRLLRTLLAPALVTLALAGNAIAQTLPFRGSFTGIGSPTAAMSGHATRLGHFTGTGAIVPTGATTFTGVFAWRAANGDLIWGSLAGVLTGAVGPGVFTYQETATILGGTGRFAGATGTQVATGTTNFITSAFDGVFDGHITLIR